MTAKHSLGWIGMGRMGFPMAERLLKAGHPVSIWNRTRAKAQSRTQTRIADCVEDGAGATPEHGATKVVSGR